MYQANIDEVTAKIYLPRLLIDSQFCAGSFVGEIAPGDSGGPAMLRSYNSGPQFTVVGVVSGKFSLGDGYYVYLGHEDVLSWITDTLDKMKNNQTIANPTTTELILASTTSSPREIEIGKGSLVWTNVVLIYLIIKMLNSL